jgi:hypothetical protein
MRAGADRTFDVAVIDENAIFRRGVVASLATQRGRHQLPRVLVGGFGPVARRGISAMLGRVGIAIIGECGLDAVMTVLGSAAPDVLVDIDAIEGSTVAIAAARAHPA